jgi:hypothetical protein
VPKNRKELRVIALTVIGVLFVVCIAFIFRKRPYDPVSTVEVAGKRGIAVDAIGWGKLPSLSPQKPLSPISPPSPSTVVAEATATPEARLLVPQPTRTVRPTVLYLHKLPFFRGPPEAIGFVDTDRLLAAHPPASDSQEARASAISDIQRATASCAIAHECAVVVDISGKTVNGVPFLLSAAEILDLTDEVMQRLAQQ